MSLGPPPCFEAWLQKAGDPNSWAEAFFDPLGVGADLDADLRGEDRGPTSTSPSHTKEDLGQTEPQANGRPVVTDAGCGGTLTGPASSEGDSDPGEFETRDVRGSGERERSLSLDPRSAAAFLPSLIHSTNACCQLCTAMLQKGGGLCSAALTFQWGDAWQEIKQRGKLQTTASQGGDEQERTWSLPWSVHTPSGPAPPRQSPHSPRDPAPPRLVQQVGAAALGPGGWGGTHPDVDRRRSASLHARTSPGHQPGQAAPPGALS